MYFWIINKLIQYLGLKGLLVIPTCLNINIYVGNISILRKLPSNNLSVTIISINCKVFSTEEGIFCNLLLKHNKKDFKSYIIIIFTRKNYSKVASPLNSRRIQCCKVANYSPFESHILFCVHIKKSKQAFKNLRSISVNNQLSPPRLFS